MFPSHNPTWCMTGMKQVEQFPSHLATWQKTKFCPNGNPNESLCSKKMLKVKVETKESKNGKAKRGPKIKLEFWL